MPERIDQADAPPRRYDEQDRLRQSSKNLDVLYRLADAAPGFHFRWWTRQTDKGWEAEIRSTHKRGPTPRIGGEGVTEAAALDAAAGLTLYGWTSTTPALKRAMEIISALKATDEAATGPPIGPTTQSEFDRMVRRHR